VGGAAQVPGDDERVVRVDHRLLDGPAEDVLRVGHHVLVDRGVQADQHDQGVALPPAGPA